jgi:hypothetical protein
MVALLCIFSHGSLLSLIRGRVSKRAVCTERRAGCNGNNPLGASGVGGRGRELSGGVCSKRVHHSMGCDVCNVSPLETKAGTRHVCGKEEREEE